MKKINTWFFASIFLSIGVLLLLSILSLFTYIERLGDIVNDSLTYKQFYTSNLHNDDIVIIKIDDRTLDTLWKSDLWMIAFDKWVYADLITKVFDDYGAATLWVDIVFANPSVLWPTDEQKLATVLESYSDRVVIATRSDYTPHPLCLYSSVQHGAINSSIEQEVLRVFPTKPVNYDIASECLGANIYPWNEKNISLFSREVLDTYAQVSDPFSKQSIEENLKIFDAAGREHAYIEYYSNGRTNQDTFWYQSYSFVDVYLWRSETPQGEKINLEWKIVLLWEVGTLIHDSHFTPIHQRARMPGVEINANIITTMQLGRDIQNLSVLWMFLIFFTLQFVIILSVLYARSIVALMTLSLAIILLLALWWYMYLAGSILNIFLWVLGCILSLFFAYIYKFQVTDRDKRAIKKQFSSYVSPDVVEEISKNPDSVLVKGETRNMTIYFSDIEGFTGLSERAGAEQTVELLNEYFSEMTKIIYNNKWTLDKYIWDAVMCFFNAPLFQENHSYFACLTALQQQKRIWELNIIWKQKWLTTIKSRVGIHTWDAVHGNIGSSETRVNYTVIWDSVNLASRIEWVGKMYGVYICVSQEVYSLQKDSFYFRELDLIRVKGREKPVRIYELIHQKLHPLSAKSLEYLERYARALDIYRQGDFAAAREIFLKNIGDKSSEIMWKRCETLLAWEAKINQGVFDMLTK